MRRYENGEIIKFKVVDETITRVYDGPSIPVFIVTDGDREFYVKKHLCQAEQPMPKYLYCRVVAEIGKGIKLQQDFGYLFESYYTENSPFEFVVQKVIDTQEGFYYKLTDQYGFWHKLYANRTLNAYEEGDRVSCFVREVQRGKAYIQLYEVGYYRVYGAIDRQEEQLRVVGIDRKTQTERYFLVQQSPNSEIKAVPMYPFQFDLPIPGEITCSLIVGDDTQSTITQSRRSVLSQYYEEEKQYPFTVSKIVNVNAQFYILEDCLGFSHQMYDVNNRFDLKTGDEVVCTVKYIKDDGCNLHLIPFEEDSIVGIFISARQLFDEIELPQMYMTYFEDLRELERKSKSPFLQKMFYDHDRRHNLWIFSYLNFNKYHKISDDVTLGGSINLCIKIDEWILESGFLKTFSNSKRVEIIQKTESELQMYRSKLEALEMVSSDTYLTFVQEFVRKMKKGAHVLDFNRKIEVLKFVIELKSSVLHTHLLLFAELFSLLYNNNLMTTQELEHFERLLCNYITDVEVRCNKIYGVTPVHTMPKEVLHNSIILLCCRVLLVKRIGCATSLAISLSMLCRYISAYTGTSYILDTGLCILTKGYGIGSLELFKWEDVCTANIEKIEAVLREAEKLEPVKHTVLYNKSSIEASVELINGSIVLFSKSMNCERTIEVEKARSGSFLRGMVQIGGDEATIPKLSMRDSFSGIQNYWGQFSKFCEQDNEQEESESKNVRVRFNNLHKTWPSKAFFTILSGAYRGKIGMLTTAQLLHVSSFEGVFSYGDELSCRIKDVDEKTRLISLSLDNYQAILRSQKTKVYDRTALVVKNMGSNDIWVTQDGIVCKSKVHNGSHDLGTTCRVRVCDTHPDNPYPMIDVIEHVEEQLDLDQIKRTYINEVIKIEPAGEHVTLKQIDLTGRIVVRELICYLYYALEEATDLKTKYCYSHLGLFLTELINDRSRNYFLSHIHFIDNLEQMLAGQKLHTCYLKDVILSNFPMLEEMGEVMLLLGKIGAKAYTAELLEYVKNEDDTLHKMVLAHNLLIDIEGMEDQRDALRRKLYTHMATQVLRVDQATSSPLPQFRGDTVEFIKSMLFSGDTQRYSRLLQMKLLMQSICGFLNAKGGRVIIGANSDGELVGIERDLELMGVSRSSYLCLLREQIVAHFGHDINGLIDIKMNVFDSCLYCEIEVPEYPEPVTYKKEYWVRQGGKNWMLTGRDLVLFIKRKIKKQEEVKPNMDTRALYLCFFKNGSYGLFDQEQHNDILFCLPLAREFSDDLYILLGYENGCVNRVPTSQLDALSYERIYSKGWNTEANLIFVAQMGVDDQLVVNSIVSGESKCEVYDLLSTRKTLLCSAKGRRISHKYKDMQVLSYTIEKKK